MYYTASKFVKPGQFPCRVCGTVYQWSDMRDACEARSRDLDDTRSKVLDHLKADAGETIVKTMYVGNDWAQLPKKSGLFLVWEMDTVKEKRVVPNMHNIDARWHGEVYGHMALYRIFEHDSLGEELRYGNGMYWDDMCGAGVPLGPLHYWSRNVVHEYPFARDWMDEHGKDWMDYVKEKCRGPRNKETLLSLKNEGYDIHDSDVEFAPA